jgi:hypothetical protein
MGQIEITRLARNPYSLGLVVRYLSDRKPFADFDFGQMVNALMFQIHQGTHLVATRNDAIAGYLGWLRVAPENARAWQAGTEKLFARPDGAAVAVTVFVCDRPEDIGTLIRAAKRAEPGRSVYWKRYFRDGRAPETRAVEVRGRVAPGGEGAA